MLSISSSFGKALLTKKNWTTVFSLCFLASFLSVCLYCAISLTFAQSDEQRPEFGGMYDDLDPEQQRLVRDWIDRYNSVTGHQLEEQTTYDQLSLSARTTFEAVTHALLTSELSDSDERLPGNALQLVQSVDSVHGKIKGARGDLQFRLYATLIPGARDRLESSREFNRGRDNTIFHKGYPLNYRQQGGVPSIQISMSRDEKRADIDVDYRSSKFPAALFNGHLTASNSNVKAGNNYGRHINRWSGLVNWWENFFALPFVWKDSPEESSERRFEGIPLRPRSGRSIQQAAFDFLDSWLVQGSPELSLAYVSGRAFECTDFGTGEIDYGMAPFRILTSMREVNDLVGEVESIESVAQGVRLSNPEMRVVAQPHHSSFVLYDVSESFALALDCGNRSLAPDEVPEGSSTIYGKHFVTVFHLKVSDTRGETLSLLWEREGRDWKIVAYEVEPEADTETIPDTRLMSGQDESLEVEADPQLIRASDGFLKAWLIEGNVDRALQYMAREVQDCVKIFSEEQLSSDATMQTLRSGLEEARREIGTPETLDEAIEAIEPVNPDVLVVRHANDGAYALVSLPDYVGDSLRCTYRLGGERMLPRPQRPTYGKYYATEVMLELIAGDPAVLALIWSLREQEWKIVAYDIISP
jgi:hypothetical protein